MNPRRSPTAPCPVPDATRPAVMNAVPHPGDVLHVGPEASVQFAGPSAIRLRVIRVDDRPTYRGWCWLDGYQLDTHGQAVQRRTIFVRLAGLRKDSGRTDHRAGQWPSQPVSPRRHGSSQLPNETTTRLAPRQPG
jgi:hypothetical protein